MRRFTTVSITMLAGIVVAPACASIVGIDTNQPLLEDASSPSATPTGTGTTPGSSSSSSGGTSSGSADSGPCGLCLSGGFTRCDAANNCIADCDPSTTTCTNTYVCPEGVDCEIVCKNNACLNATCKGGKSCTFDCSTNSCAGATCSSPTCTFKCGQGTQCDGAACVGATSSCNKICINAAGKPCVK